MRDHTHPPRLADGVQQVGLILCAWHRGYSLTTKLVQDEGGDTLPACLSCRRSYDLLPVDPDAH